MKQTLEHRKANAAAAFTIIRLRGTQNLNPKTKDTLRFLRLNRVNHAVVLPQSDTTIGMLQVAKDYVTWGEVDAATLAEVIKARGRLVGNAPLSDAHLAKHTPYKTIDALAAAVAGGQFRYQDVPDVKPLFRLHPARNGLEGIKRSIQAGGALGYRGAAINKLLGKMIHSDNEGTGATAPKPTVKANAKPAAKPATPSAASAGAHPAKGGA